MEQSSSAPSCANSSNHEQSVSYVGTQSIIVLGAEVLMVGLLHWFRDGVLQAMRQ